MTGNAISIAGWLKAISNGISHTVSNSCINNYNRTSARSEEP